VGRGLRAQDECHVGVWHLGLGSCEKAMRGVLLEKIRTRTPKIGVQSPLGNWMNRGLGDWAAQRVQTKHILENPVADGPAIRDFVLQRQVRKSWNELTPTSSGVIYRQTYGGKHSLLPDPIVAVLRQHICVILLSAKPWDPQEE